MLFKRNGLVLHEFIKNEPLLCFFRMKTSELIDECINIVKNNSPFILATYEFYPYKFIFLAIYQYQIDRISLRIKVYDSIQSKYIGPLHFPNDFYSHYFILFINNKKKHHRYKHIDGYLDSIPYSIMRFIDHFRDKDNINNVIALCLHNERSEIYHKSNYLAIMNLKENYDYYI
jgi:hypothetical protein